MQKDMDNNLKTEAKSGKVDYGKLWQDLKKHKKRFYIVLPIVFVAVAALSLCVPNYYKCTVVLAPEMSMSTARRAANSLSNLANSLGVNLVTSNNSGDALFPTLYPELMNSVAFRASLFPIEVQREEGGEVMTYYDYLKDGQKLPWWSQALKAGFEAIGSLFKKEEDGKTPEVNAFKLTKEQFKIAKAIAKKVVCEVDNKTFVITINVTDQDPLIAATMADSVQKRLQDFITEYRTRKARIDLEHNRRIYNETKTRYDKAVQDYANFADANQRVFLERVHSKQTKLQAEMSIQAQAYEQISGQLMAAEAKVQEATPAFTTLQPASVPIKKAGPKRGIICLAFLFLAFIGTTLYCFHKEGDLIPLMKSLLGASEEE